MAQGRKERSELTVQQEGKIVMYGTTWCGDCARAKRVFDRHGIGYEWVNIEQHPEAVAIVMKINGGMRSVPTIVFPDGSILTEPTDHALEVKLGVHST